MSQSACIVGCAGEQLSPEEEYLLRTFRPWGVILFERNLRERSQALELCQSIRGALGRPDAPILIDQEGGRVQSLRRLSARRFPAARAFKLALGSEPVACAALVELGARLIAAELRSLGVTVNCMPVLDVPSRGAHPIIGDRAYAETAAWVSELAGAAAGGLLSGGVLPILKHIPGHGRAMADSHHDLPRITASHRALASRDLKPFKALARFPIAMTAHAIYDAVDPLQPATLSRRVIRGLIRGAIGFDGLLIADDLAMGALQGSRPHLARTAIGAGCDLVMLCRGTPAETADVAAAAGALGPEAAVRAERALAMIAESPPPIDLEASWARFDAALAGS